MSKCRTGVDANVLIAAWSAQGEMFTAALSVLEDPVREFIVSDALWLEVMPKALYHQREAELAFYRGVFQRAECRPWSAAVVDKAKALAGTYGLAAMDAVHLAVAIDAGADEFISAEKPTKPMFRVREIRTRSLWMDP